MRSSPNVGVAILRRVDGIASARYDRAQAGRCRVCRCVDELACPSGCSWINEAATLCTACVIFAELSRRNAVDLLFDGGYLASRDLRRVNRALQDAIEDFTVLIETLATAKPELNKITFALRSWRTTSEVEARLEHHGLRIANVSGSELRRLVCP